MPVNKPPAHEYMGANFLAPAQGSTQPQIQSQFEVVFDLSSGSPVTTGAAGGSIDFKSADKNSITLATDTSGLPNITFAEVELHHLNERVYMAGGVTFETIPLNCKDMIDGSTASAMWRWSLRVYNPVTGKMGLAADYKRNGLIYVYGPGGERKRTWQLIGCWPNTINFGSTLDYSAKEAVNHIESTIRYDRAIPVNQYESMPNNVPLGTVVSAAA